MAKRFSRYSYILTSYAIGILLFTLFRLLNTWVYCSGAETWPDFEGQYFMALVMGWRFDTVISCYLLSLPLLMMIVGDLARIRVKPYYLQRKRDDDVIISASPLFLVAPAMARLGIKGVIASPVDMRTGVYSGLNCHGEEKVRRFGELYPGAEIDEFYSDSLSDSPLARLAKKAFLVKGNELLPWPED